MQSAMFSCLLSYSPLPAHLAGLHLEVSSVPCAAAFFVTWTERIFCGKQIAEDIAGNWQGKGKWTFWKEGELWAVEIWFIPSVCNRLVRQSQEWCLRLIPTKCYYTKWLSHRQHESSVRFHCLDWSLPWQNYRQSLCNSRADCFSLFIQTGGQQPMQKQSTDTAENRINAALSPDTALSPDLALTGECML